MKKRSNKSGLNLNVLGEIFAYRNETLSDPATLDLTTHPPIEDIHELLTAKRLSRAASNSPSTFELTAVEGPASIGAVIPRSEQDSNDFIEYVAAPVVCGNKVIYRHDLVRAAIKANKPIAIFRLEDDLPLRSVIPFQTRYASREGRISAPARMEIARVLYRNYGFDVESIQKLFVGPKGSKWGLKSITSHIRVGDLYEEWTGVPVGLSAHGPSSHNFSSILRFVEQRKIRELMDQGPTERKRFVEIAINSADTGSGRVHDDLAAICKHEDTLEVLYTEGMAKARASLRANHPENAADKFPLNDLEAAVAKIRNPEIQLILSKQAEKKSSVSTKMTSITTELVAILASVDNSTGNRLAEALGGADKMFLVKWVAENALDEMTEFMDNKAKTIQKLQKLSRV